MPYKIALLSKYPPLEGGIAARTYWLACGLAARGHEIHVITNGISAGGEYHIKAADSGLTDIKNLFVHRITDDIPWHLPEDHEYGLTLLNLTLNVIREHSIQILDTGYLVPYGIVGHIAKRFTGIPHVIRHGGSDIEKFLKAHILEIVLRESIADADRVVTTMYYKDLFESITPRTIPQPAYVPDESIFVHNNVTHPQFRLAYIGKINHYWQQKNLRLVVSIMHQLSGQFDCSIVGQGKGLDNFQRELGPDIASGIKWQPFVAPWEMPRLLGQLDAIFILESSLPHPVISNLVIEAVSCGVGIITDRADFAETYRGIFNLDNNQVLVITSPVASTAAECVSQWIKNRNYNIQSSNPLISYSEYITANEGMYSDILGN